MIKSRLKIFSIYDKIIDSSHLQESIALITKPIFTVSDSPLSYRQVNYLGKTEVLPEKRESKKEWRKFSLKEVIFLSIVKELRQYGFRESYLLELRKIFFEVAKGFEAEVAILAVLGGFGVYITIDGKGEIYFYDMPAFSHLRDKKQTSYFFLNLNEVILPIWEKVGKRRIEYKDEDALLSEIMEDLVLSKQEQKLLRLIRHREYVEITVNKQNDDSFVVKADKREKLKEKELIEMIRTKQFGNIEVKKRDGKIVHIRVAETHKI